MSGGEVSGEIREAVRGAVGDEEIPYQLSVFASSVEVLYRLRDSGLTPGVVAGHSLGEYAAVRAAGSLGLEDAARLVAKRDRLMSKASAENPGGMLALVGADPLEVQRAVEELPESEGVAVAANFNTPRQTVISGEVRALGAVAERVGGKSRRLDVAGAFHSPLMREAAVEMETLLAEVELNAPEIPVVSGMDGSMLATADDVRLALRDQMLSPVRWVAVVERFLQLGVEEMIEAGEGGTLVRMLRDFKTDRIRGRNATEVLA